MSTLWRERFDVDADRRAQLYTASLDLDHRLGPYDVRYSHAHVRALERAGVVSTDETAKLHEALDQVAAELERGELALDPELEDIHTVIENRVTTLAGAAGAKLHSGRSRNDQCVTVMRMFMLDATDAASASIVGLQEALLGQARAHRDTLVPAYSHMRRAQPIVLAHHLLAYFWMLQRDRGRLAGARQRTALSGAGAAACAGSGIALDRVAIAAELGFDDVTRNSLDTVSDRDFILEFLAAGTMCAGHLSRLAADLCLWSGPEFDFVALDMAFCTGSSMMPQKVNPDPLELARAKVARLNAEFASLSGLLHGLPLGYQRDLQDDKRPLLHGSEVLISTLDLLAAVVRTTTFKVASMKAACEDAGLLATDWAEEMVGSGVPFRESYGVVGRLMRRAAEQGVDPRAMSPEELGALHSSLPAAIAAVPDAAASVARKITRGSPGPEALQDQMVAAEAALGRPPS